MFYYVNGTVAHTAPYLAVIDCGGVGYACRTTNNTLARLKKGESAKLYTYLNVREDAMELYGFATENELNCSNCSFPFLAWVPRQLSPFCLPPLRNPWL